MNTTTPTTERPSGPIVEKSAFEDFLSCQENLPAWWLDLKKEAWARFEEFPAPTRKDERWRFANVNAVSLDGFRLPAPLSETDAATVRESADQLPENAGKLVFADDQLIDRQDVSAELEARGVVWKPLAQAVSENEDLLREHFMAQPIKLGSEKFSALHSALCTAGSFLYVPNGVEIELPLVASHWTVGERHAVFPHTLLIAGEQSKVTLVDFFGASRSDSHNFICGVNDLYVGPGARVNYICSQNWGDRSLALQLNSTQAFRDSYSTSLNLNLGGAFSRTESHSQALGPGAHSKMLSLTIASGTQEFDQRTLQTHKAPHTVSDLLYKNALLNTARTLFSGLIRVEKEGQQTDAYQTNRNLLLNPEAEANSLPGLEILANDVKCSHGATTGQIDPDQLYYMRSRGIPELVAKQLLVFGFFDEVIDKLDDDAVAAKLREQIHAKFARL